jgi:hypothetical protein
VSELVVPRLGGKAFIVAKNHITAVIAVECLCRSAILVRKSAGADLRT